MNTAASALTIDGLGVARGGRQVLTDVDLTVRAGEVVVLAGANGAGKSTLLQAVLGLLPATGRIRIGGADLSALDPPARARAVAFVPQRSLLRAPLTVRAVVASGRYAHRGVLARETAADAAAIDQALERSGAADLRHRIFTELSGGEQQRVLVARALAAEAGVLLGDEPTTGLDPRHALGLLATLRAIADEGRAVLVVLHHLDEVRRLADRVVLLAEGRVHCTAPPAEALTAEHLRTVYGVEPDAAAGFGLRLWRGGG